MKLIPLANITPPAPDAVQREKPRKGIEIRAAADGEVEVLIYTEIGYWYLDPEWFIRDLMMITAPVIRVRINSNGGDVFGGVAIYNALVRHNARIIVHVDGLAASIASLIAMAGDEIHMSKGAFIMIHDPRVGIYGTAPDLRKVAGVLDQVAGSMAEIYADRSGASVEQVAEWMRDETFFTANEARQAGLADVEDDTEAIAAKFDLSRFPTAPPALRARAAAAGARAKVTTVRQLEALLREEGGLTHAQAKKIASASKATLDLRDEDGGPEQVPTPAGEPPVSAADAAALEAVLGQILVARLQVGRALTGA